MAACVAVLLTPWSYHASCLTTATLLAVKPGEAWGKRGCVRLSRVLWTVCRQTGYRASAAGSVCRKDG
jgi:hypothetical protein